jgi:hypothetical protein
LQGDAPPQSSQLEVGLVKVSATCTSMAVKVLLAPASVSICIQFETRPRPMILIAHVGSGKNLLIYAHKEFPPVTARKSFNMVRSIKTVVLVQKLTD